VKRGRGYTTEVFKLGPGRVNKVFIENDPTPEEQAAITEFCLAWDEFTRIKEEIPALRRKLHKEKRRMLRAFRTLRTLNEDDYIHDIECRCNVKRSQAYNIDYAVSFAEAAGFLDKPVDWELTNSGDWESSPMPEITPMADAECVNGELRQELIKRAKEGRFPSRNEIKRLWRGDDVLRIKLDCKSSRHREPDIDAAQVNKVLRRMLIRTLRALAKRGSEVAKANLKKLEEAIAEQREMAKQRYCYPPVPKKITLSAEFDYAIPVQPWRREYIDDQAALDAKYAKHAAARRRAQPKGWYMNQLRDSGDLEFFGHV
jgi:hypothetical protein